MMYNPEQETWIQKAYRVGFIQQNKREMDAQKINPLISQHITYKSVGNESSCEIGNISVNIYSTNKQNAYLRIEYPILKGININTSK